MSRTGDSDILLSVSGLHFSHEARLQSRGQTRGQNKSSDEVVSRRWDISGLNLTVKSGEIVSLLGASGCGKTTLLNLIAGLLAPESGSIQVRAPSGATCKTGYIFQQDALLPWRTVEQNLLLAREITFSESKEHALGRITQYLNSFHLPQEVLRKYPSELSGGMRQRVSIIQSLMFDPLLLLLDEPFSALDYFTKLKLESEFYQLIKDKGKGAVLVTHDIEESIAMGDRVIIMTKGGVIKREFAIDKFDTQRSPESIRGTLEFGDLYRAIWSELQAVIRQ